MSENHLATTLERLASAQSHERAVSRSQIDPTSARSIFDGFIDCSAFSQICEDAVRFRFRNSLHQSPIEAAERFTGRMHQEMGLLTLSALQPINRIVFDKLKTIEAWRAAFPGSKKQRYPLGLDALSPTPNPDGLLVSPEGQVLGSLEATTSVTRKYVWDKVKAADKIRRFGPHLLRLADCIFVVPETREKLSKPRGWVKFEQVPYTHSELDNYLLEVASCHPGLESVRGDLVRVLEMRVARFK